jgi:hypothetical protein
VYFSRKLGVLVKYFIALLSLLFACLFQIASASTLPMQLEFEDLSVTDPSVLELEGATITHLAGGVLFVYEPGEFGMPAPGGFCALLQVGRNAPKCKSDASIVFDAPVDQLTFQTFFVSGGDAALIEIVVDGFALPGFSVNSNTIVDLSEWSGIKELRLFDRSGRSDAGLAYGSFSFVVTAIPIPAALPPFALALLFLSSRRFRRNRR